MTSAEMRADQRRFELTTPEHVAIDFVLADLGSRFGALILDVLLQFLILFVLLFLAAMSWGASGNQGALTLLLMFFVRNFYFTAAEVYGRGQTPGKRVLHLRVVARDGGPLATDQIFARNLTRDLEIFLPATVLLAPEGLLPNAPGWAQVATVVWILALGLLPFFNRQRARLGDLVAGTVVVVEPHGELQEDLADLRGELAVERFTEYSFSREQLDIYGIRELQVLEDLLRRRRRTTRTAPSSWYARRSWPRSTGIRRLSRSRPELSSRLSTPPSESTSSRGCCSANAGSGR